jgi:hypothetical protein
MESSYEVQRNEITQISAHVILLDRMLAHYGPETKAARDLLRRYVGRLHDQLWHDSRLRPSDLEPTSTLGEAFYDKIQELSPQNEVQRSLQAQAQRMTIDLGQTRWLMFEQSLARSRCHFSCCWFFG